ncbi:MAG: Permease for cytosine/purines uracil thiamine allantoin [Candidatus Tokpelaia hoelldobleri]|uniref:Permease for cytosine/purines uracil thiamine allantoin n=1 Tax=Candidatus Tokpelaia hoelldobleri TaxID=1902579 RepID=A0A1U9JVU3_9HYPH|nr:MAG: Permease for cytosine/purines uracil thiamine allantoin [Candidatus Tokpelaia hoelldoblerii]
MTASNRLVEGRTIDRVPECERHGTAKNQFTLWMATTLQITAVVDGALAVVFGAEALAAIIGLLIGNCLGGIVMALHAVQGPRLGLPQMISSRAQFGVKGATLPLLLVIIMYLGFAATGTVLSGQAINLVAGVETPAFGMIVFGCLTGVIVVVGYRLIHWVGRFATMIACLGFGYILYRLFSVYAVAEAFGQKPFSIATFLTAVALAAGWQMTYAPYVADYSRYLPSQTSAAKTFWSTFLGAVIGSQIAMTFGVLIAALDPSFLANQIGVIGMLAGPALAAFTAYALIVLGKITVNSLNAYGGCMTMITAFSAFQNRNTVSKAVRIGCICSFIALSVLIGIWASADFLSRFKSFMLLLLTVFTPWSAINLIDYYLISKERVDIPALYDPKGRYGVYNIPALVCYAIGILVQVPFFNFAFYQGAIAKMLAGADISWLVALCVTSLFYYVWAKKTQSVPEQMVFSETGTAAFSPNG